MKADLDVAPNDIYLGVFLYRVPLYLGKCHIPPWNLTFHVYSEVDFKSKFSCIKNFLRYFDIFLRNKVKSISLVHQNYTDTFHEVILSYSGPYFPAFGMNTERY